MAICGSTLKPNPLCNGSKACVCISRVCLGGAHSTTDTSAPVSASVSSIPDKFYEYPSGKWMLHIISFRWAVLFLAKNGFVVLADITDSGVFLCVLLYVQLSSTFFFSKWALYDWYPRTKKQNFVAGSVCLSSHNEWGISDLQWASFTVATDRRLPVYQFTPLTTADAHLWLNIFFLVQVPSLYKLYIKQILHFHIA